MPAGRHTRHGRGRRVAESRRRTVPTTVRRIGAATTLTVLSMGSVVVAQSALGSSPSIAAAHAATVIRYAAVAPVTLGRSTSAISRSAFRSGVRGSNATGPAQVFTGSFSVPGCPQPTAPGDFPNGKIPAAYLCALSVAPGQKLRSDAAAAWVRLDAAYVERFGTHICMTDSYRSLKVQKQLYKRKPLLAAFPGSSNHGLGVAVDLCGGIEDYGSVPHAWLSEHGAAYGWTNPAWAQPGGSSKFEPWHWEYAAPADDGPSD